MDEQEKLYLDFIKQDIKHIPNIEDPGQQANMIYNAIKQLCILSDEQLLKNIQLFYDEQQRINTEKQKTKEQLLSLMEDERKNLKQIYDNVLCKL